MAACGWTKRVLKAMEAFNGIAPAHNPPYITGIRLFAKRMPKTPLIGLFETAFYQWAPEAAMRYAVPRSWHEAGCAAGVFMARATSSLRNARRNCSDARMSRERARIFTSTAATARSGKPDLRVISCHLGGSSSHHRAF